MTTSSARRATSISATPSPRVRSRCPLETVPEEPSSSSCSPVKLSRPQKRRRRLQLLAVSKGSPPSSRPASEPLACSLARLELKVDFLLAAQLGLLPGPACPPRAEAQAFCWNPEAPVFAPASDLFDYADELRDVVCPEFEGFNVLKGAFAQMNECAPVAANTEVVADSAVRDFCAPIYECDPPVESRPSNNEAVRYQDPGLTNECDPSDVNSPSNYDTVCFLDPAQILESDPLVVSSPLNEETVCNQDAGQFGEFGSNDGTDDYAFCVGSGSRNRSDTSTPIGSLFSGRGFARSALSSCPSPTRPTRFASATSATRWSLGTASPRATRSSAR
mmetsp:Transcript_57345/g.178018  ORF Transcript_57345/g.178018 Transcript_57345/m.178018 type:complete len:333 (+) Transcript_57345:125-1123(+)